MAPAAAMQGESIGLAIEAVGLAMPLVTLALRLSASDEGGQTLGVGRLLLARRLRASTIRSWLAPTVRLAAAVGLLLARRKRLSLARQIGLRFARPERLLAPGAWLLRALLVGLVAQVVARLLLRPIVRIGLAELLLRRRDQAEIVLGVLEIVLGRNRIPGGLGVTRELEIFVRDVVGSSANLHIRAVRLINPRQGILIAPVVLLIVAPAHTLVVMMLLTVSHGLLFNDS
jgi:hypothetical protein